MSPINIGVVGLSKEGCASLYLLGPLLRSPLSYKYNLTALSALSPESAAESAKIFSELTKRKVNPYYGDTSQIATDENVDLVIVAVWSPFHMEAALPVIEAGKDIFIVWPCGGSLRDAKQLLEATQRKGVRSMVGFQGTQSPVIKKVREWVSSGKIGRVLASSALLSVPKEANYWGPVVAARNSHTADENSGASMLDVLVGHFIKGFTMVLGEFSSITATTKSQYHTSIEVDQSGSPTGRLWEKTAADQVAFSGVLKSGAGVSVHCRGGHPNTKGRLPLVWVIDGEEGSIKLESNNPYASFMHALSPTLYLNGEEVKVNEEDHRLGYIGKAWLEFSKGAAGNYPSLEDGVEIHRIIDTISRSAREGKRIDFV